MRICVFCGSSPGVNPEFLVRAADFGRLLASRGIGLVYGGARVGLMGAIADAALSQGGEVIGVIPRALAAREVAHLGLTELRVVESMHERKALMAELSDAFVALPGGAGTMEEIFEVWTWSQLGLHQKPCALLDLLGFYETLRAFLDHVSVQGFLSASSRASLIVEEEPEALLRALRSYVPPGVPQWITERNS